MKILAIDLAWGTSGWVLWDNDAHDPVVSYGEITTKETQSKKLGDSEKLSYAIASMRGNLRDLIANRKYRVDVVVYEYTDWHRGLGGTKNYKVEYAKERGAQSTLSRAQAIIHIVCLDLDLPVVGIGAMEARREFCDCTRKNAAAEVFAHEYSYRFRYRKERSKDDTRFLVDTSLGQYVSEHISDAFVIAAVYEKRWRRHLMEHEALANEN